MDDSQAAFASQYPQYGFDLDMMKVCFQSTPSVHPVYCALLAGARKGYLSVAARARNYEVHSDISRRMAQGTMWLSDPARGWSYNLVAALSVAGSCA